MENSEILTYALEGIHSHIKRLENETEVFDGMIYRLSQSVDFEGTDIIKVREQLQLQLQEQLNELKKQYNELAHDIREKNIDITHK